jgi:membrane-associated phospholipid phosphatase
MIMQFVRPLSLLLLTCLCFSAAPATQPTSLAPDDFDFKAMLGDPPVDGSEQQKQETAAMLKLQEQRTPEEIARCESEVAGTPFTIGASVVGAWFDAKDLPATTALMIDVARKGTAISGAAKSNWRRDRPYQTDNRIKPCVKLELTFSYPSGHATRGMLWGVLLAEMFPDHRDALLARGRQFGTDRTLAGVHYPTDVAAGQKLGAEIARRMLADPEFLAKLEKAKEECHAAAVK